MSSQRALAFTADLDISDVTRGLNRITAQSKTAGAAVGRVGGGLGRGARGAGGVVGRGAGLGAGAAIFEQAIMKILELFEDTPVLEDFITALDGIFKAAAPVIGVLLKSLTPVILALTPAIVPLAKALTPLVELFGLGLLVAVELVTPAIVLFAKGLEKVTTFIKNTVLAGFRFVVDQLNKLPFVDIKANLNTTGSSFDTMAGQIANAGAAAGTGAGTAEGNFGALATAVNTSGTNAGTAAGQADSLAMAVNTAGTNAGTATTSVDTLATATATAGTNAGGATTPVNDFAAATDAERIAADKAKIATDLWAQAARENKAAADPLTTTLGNLSDEMDETYTASDNLGIIIGKTAPQISDLTTLYIAQNMAATTLSPVMGALSDEMDEAYSATNNLGVIIGASKGPTADLASAVDTMTMRINDAKTAADLNQMAFEALTPDLQAAAIEMGIFRAGVVAVGKAAAVVGDNLTRLGIGGGSRIDDPGGLGYDRVRGTSGRQGGLNGEDIAGLIARSPNGAILDPYNGTIHIAGGGRLTRSGGNLRGRDLRDYRELYQNTLNEYDLPGAINVTVVIDGAAVATATTQAESEGAM